MLDAGRVIVQSTDSTVRLISPLRRFLILPLKEANFQARGFSCSDSAKQMALESIGRTFIGGYNASLSAANLDELAQFVAGIPQGERGFAAEGAAMGIAVADSLRFRKPWLAGYIAALDRDFTHLIHVGAGWALARVPWRKRHILAVLDPVHRWLAMDGLGFHDTYFFHRRVLGGWRRVGSGYASRAYDQGVGRALWFVSGGSAIEAKRLVALFSQERQGDLWSGLGLAMAYAGLATRDDLVDSFQTAGRNGPDFAQGIAFACEARALACHVPGHTDVAARAVWDVDASALSRLVREARTRLGSFDGDIPRYEIWRRAIAALCAADGVKP